MIKFCKILLLILFAGFVFSPMSAEALTLNQLRAQLSQLERQANQQQSTINQTNRQMNAARNNITNTVNRIENTRNEIEQANNRIQRSNVEIGQRDQEIKELAKFMQLTGNETFYLEYLFGSETMEDFIFRAAIINKLAESNQARIKNLNNLIEEQEQHRVTMRRLQSELATQQRQLNSELNQLGNQRSRMLEHQIDINAEIRQARATIRMYERAGCRPNQDVRTCNVLPRDTRFWRPVESGRITSEFGMRRHPIFGDMRMHLGVDMAGGSRVLYSVASGRVAWTGWTNGGGWTVDIHHTINGRAYTSTYMHLASPSPLRAGQTVTHNTVVGTMGTTGNSTGIHLHLSIATCHRGLTCVGNDWVARNINPRNVINFPAGGGFWSNRTQRF